MNKPAMPERARGARARFACGDARLARKWPMLRNVRRAVLLALALGTASFALHAAPCGRLTLANMNWQSAEVLAHVDRFILTHGYGCEVELVAGDTVPTLTSMIERGQPDVAPEAWVNGVREAMDKAVAEGRLHYAAKALRDGGVEGWWIPKYVADKNPQIRTIADALRHPQLFPAPEEPAKGGVYSCPAGWTCEILTRNLFKAYGAAAKGFVLVDTGSAAGLDGSLAKAYERRQGWLGYYWAPTALMGRYAMVRLDEGVKHDAAPVAGLHRQARLRRPEAERLGAGGGVHGCHRALQASRRSGLRVPAAAQLGQRHRQLVAGLDAGRAGQRRGRCPAFPEDAAPGVEAVGRRGRGGQARIGALKPACRWPGTTGFPRSTTSRCAR